MRIAVTGATGFLGGYLIRALYDAGHDVAAWYRTNSRPLPDRYSVDWIQGELGNSNDAKRLVDSADAVIHCGLARRSHSFMDSPDDPLEYWHRNATGSLQLLDAAANEGVDRFIFISSGAVHETVLSDRPLDETHPLLPGTLYGACKASVETLIHHYGVSGRLCCATIRPTSIYGIAEPVEDSKWFPIIRQICSGRNVEATGGSKAVHAGDVAKAALLLLSHDDSISGQTFNCCDRMISEFEVASIAKRITGSDSVITGQPKTAKHEIDTQKIQSLGMRFGGDRLLEKTVAELIAAAR